ncbi:hypothetical protein D0504_07865 [Weissella confusa]|uniref:KxYKxGKxW signal peptide domain-containing protein n=1 Tax=Weissella confusa TaxID=1583 RepID=UPI0021BFFBF8|nr:KxYKxGKxW signal peptide domain-containing protein [Weissella confusa]MCT8393634.1 hypothetical protein [Weissella confusa]
MRQMNINKGNYEVKSHYKMYKAGKRWVVAGMATVSLLGGLLMLSTDASADNVDAVVPASESSVTTQVSTPTDSVVLDHASASVAPASSVSAEVSASSASSVAPVSVSTAASVVSAEASLSASQSLASSVVVPAEAVKVQDDLDSDGNVRKAYALATAADTQTPDSAVTPVQTNAAYTSSTEAKPASLPPVSTSGTIASSAYIKTDSAQNHTKFTYIGSAQINDYFNQTGDITNLSDVDVTDSNFKSGAYTIIGATDQKAYESSLAASRNFYTSYYNTLYQGGKYNYTGASLEAAVTSMVAVAMSGKPEYMDVPSSVSNAIKTANSVASKVLPSQSKVGDIDWKALVPEVKNEGGTLSYQSQLDVLRAFEIKGGYRLVSINQTTGAVLASNTVTGAQAVGVVMAPVQPTVMGTPSIASSKTLNNNDAIATIKNAVIAGRDMFVSNAGDVNSMLVQIRKTNDGGYLTGADLGDGQPGVMSSGYAWSTTSSGKEIEHATNVDGLSETDTNKAGVQVSTTKGAAQGDLYKGVYFDYNWTNPTLNTNGTVTATLTYTEYSDSAMTKIIGTVTTTLTVDRYMAVGLYAANGGNGNSFFGGISYFQGTNATADVNVSYKFGKNDDTLLPDTKINAVVGEKIKITDAKTTLSADTGMTVTYVAPDVPGFKIDPSSTMSAIAGSNDLMIKYVVDQDDFNQQLGKANTALSDIDASIHDLQGMIDADPSSIDVQSVLTKMQEIRKQAVDKIATLQTITDGSVNLTIVSDVQDALKKIMQGANDVSALATDAANQIDLAKEIKKNAVSIHKNISDDTDVTKAKDKINDDIASGQSAVNIANDKVDLESKVKIATQNRQDAIVAADKAVTDNTVNNALVDGAKSALHVLTGESTPTDDTHTKTEIKAGIDNLTKVSSVDVPANVMDVQDIKDAIANLTDLLTNKPTDTPTIDAALQALKNKVDQAKVAVANAVRVAKSVANEEVPVNVRDQNHTVLDAAKKHLQDVADNADSTTDDITKAQQAVTDELTKLTDARDAEIVKGKTVAGIAVPDNATDQTAAIKQLQADQDALTKLMNNGESTLTQIQDAEKLVTADLTEMSDAVSNSKTDANKVVTNWNGKSNLYTDQKDALKTIQDDIDHLNAVVKDGTSTVSVINDAKKRLQDDIDTVTDARNGSVSAGNSLVDGLTDQQKKDALVDVSVTELNKAINDGTKSAIDTAVEKVKTAVDTMINEDINDVPAVVTAKQKIVDLLKGDTVDATAVKNATDELKTVANQASDDLKAKKSAAATAEIPANLKDQFGKLDAATQKTLTDEVAGLATAAAKDGIKVSELQPKLDQLQTDLADMQKNLQNAKNEAQSVADAKTPANVADQAIAGSAYEIAKTTLDEALKNKNATASDLETARTAVTNALQDMQTNVTTAKENANKVADSWTDEANMFTDQDTSAVNQALNDLAGLSDNATQADYERVQTELSTAKKAVEKVRDDAVKAGNTVADGVSEAQKKDDLVHTSFGELTKAIATGTASEITTAADKVENAVKAIVDVPVADVPAVVSAKQKVVDLLNDKQLDDKKIADAIGELKDALKQATAVSNLKNLVNPENDGTTKASDIKAQQDVVDGILNKLKANRDAEIAKGKNVAGTAVPDNATDQTATIKQLQADQDALTALMNNEDSTLTQIQVSEKAVTDDLKKMSDAVSSSKDGANKVVTDWNGKVNLYTDQKNALETIQGDLDHLDVILKDDASTVSEINEVSKDLQTTINKVAAVRQKAVDNADVVAVKNGDNDDVKDRVAAVKEAEDTGTASDIAKAVAKLQTADATVVPTNIADDGDVMVAKKAVNDALNNDGDVDTAKRAYDNAVATAQATLKQAVTDANAVKVPANLQDQVEMAKKNKLGDVNQQVTDLHKAVGQDDTTASTLRSAMNDIQGSLDDMTTKLHTTRDAAQKLVEQTADATDTNVVAARKQVTNLLANNDTTTMTDLQNAMNVLNATSKPATANTVETSSATVESDQVSTPVANGDAAFAIVTDANGKQTVVQLDKTENGTATANVPGAKDAQVVTVPKNGNKPFIFVTDGSGTTQYTELTPNGAKTTITPDGSTTKVVDGVDVPAGANVDVIYLPRAEVSVQAGAKNVQVPGKTGYTATVTDAQGNEVTLTDGMISVDGVPAGTNYLVTYTPDPAKVVVKLGTDSGFAKGEEPAAGNTNAQTLMTVQDALNKLQKDDATLAAIVSTGYTDTKVNVTNAVEALNRVDQNLNIDGYAHRIQAPDGTQYNSLEDAVKANPTFAAGTTQMKVVYAPLDGQKIQVKDADGNVLGTVMGKSDAEIDVDDFKSVDADLQAKAEKGKLKMTVTAPDGKTYDSLMDALQATGYFDHVGLEDGPSSFDQSDAKFVATAWDETGKATAGYMVLGEPATPNDLNIQDFVVSFAPANDGDGHNNTNDGSKTGSSEEANNQNGDQVNVAGPANGSHDGSEVNNATVAGQASGAQVTGSQTGATANTAQNAGWPAQGATQNSDNTASLLAAAGNEQQAKTANSDDARITEMPDSAAVIQDSILPLESAKQAMNLTGRVTEDNFLVVVAAMVASGLFGLLLAFWRRRKEDDQATR